MKRDYLQITSEPLSPDQLLAPGVGDASLLIRSQSARAASAADLTSPPPRPGSEEHLKCPSRMGNELHHSAGRVTDLDGNPLNHHQE